MAEASAALTKSQRLERLLEISRNLTSTRDLPTLLQAIVEIACELTDSEAASILLYDSQTGQLRFEAAPGVQQNGLKEINVPIDSSVAGWIFRNAKPMTIHNGSSDPRIYREVDRALQFHTRSILGVPLMIEDKPIGVIEAVNKHDDSHYTEEDITTLETLASQAAITIQNARLLNQLKLANTELMRLDRMKSDFIAIASHELRTPLGLILGHATFLKELIEEKYQEQMEVIIRSAMRLKTIVEDMATIAHKEQGQSRVRHEPFSMSELIANLVSRFKESAKEKSIELDYDVPENDPLILEGDRDKIDITLTNLLRNAITFTDEGGQVGVKAESSDDYIKVFVVDTGIGIPEQSSERIFERFYQVESHLTRKHGGMGLGLSIAKAMVEMHQGQIWCESKEGVGSLFCINLPVTQHIAEVTSKVFKSS